MQALFWNRIITALTTVPNLRDWGVTLGILIVFGILTLLIGSWTNFIRWDTPIENWLQVSLIALLAPAFVEELGFRVILLPHPNENAMTSRWWIWAGISLLIFVLYHPLNALTLYKAGNPTFLNITFLVLATLLGIACTLAYRLIGSIWPPMLIHWVMVVVWLCLLGGYARLG